MGCSGVCVTGGGQPQVSAKTLIDVDVRIERTKALMKKMNCWIQENLMKILSQQLYKEF